MVEPRITTSPRDKAVRRIRQLHGSSCVTLAIVVLLAGVAGSVLALPASAGSDIDPKLAQMRAATARYHQLEVALAEGYVPLFDCISHAPDGAMGYHYARLDRFDAELNLAEPEVLVYAPGEHGRLHLAAVEFVIPAAAWPSAEAPEFLGQQLLYKTTVGPYPVDPYYERHAWIWRHNPNGMFADWNPNVSCPTE